MAEPEVRVTEYEVSLLPEGDINHHLYALTVAYRGGGLWAVLHLRFCLAAEGSWDYESIPSDRSDEWIATHRFPLDEALRRAKGIAPDVEVNGRTARQAHHLTSRIC